MFKSNLKEKNESLANIVLEGKAVKALIDYFYSELIEINGENMMVLLAASDCLQVDDAKHFCFDFFKSNISAKNSFDILKAADSYGFQDLDNLVRKFTEVESLRTHCEVLGLGLEGQILGLETSSPRVTANFLSTFN